MVTDYFTKWVEVIPLKVANQHAVIKFIKENLIYRFDILESIMIDQGTMFTRKKMKEFAKKYGFKLLHSTIYHAQVNGQAKATKSLILNIQKMVQNNPKQWHKLLSEVLWVYRSS